MKVVVKSPNKNKLLRYYAAAIPLERMDIQKPASEDLISFTLRTNPTDEKSETYLVLVSIVEHSSPEGIIKFVVKMKQVAAGQNITTGPAKYAHMWCMLRGDALAAFNVAVTEAGTETNDHFKLAVNALIKHFMPARALAIQK